MNSDYPRLETRLEYLEKPIKAPMTAEPPLDPSVAAPSDADALNARVEKYKRGAA